MYQYDEFDQTVVDDRVDQYQDQLKRYLNKELSEEGFRPLRLQNGLYIQRHAPMLRVAIPYGELSSLQLKTLATIAREYDQGYGHFTTRQNIQFNWIRLEQSADILRVLAKVQMHAIQTSGNCVRNITTDAFAGLLKDEIEDPRLYAELLRQFSTLHPEFSYLPRKFKIAISGSEEDRSATAFHDIGFFLVKQNGQLGFKVWVGGGMGRTPMVGSEIRSFLPVEDFFNYTESILRIYNLYGRRDNIYKARIKILVRSLGVDQFKKEVEDLFETTYEDRHRLLPEHIEDIKKRFDSNWGEKQSQALEKKRENVEATYQEDESFKRWVKQNTYQQKQDSFSAVVVSLKRPGVAPGDVSADEMDFLAECAEQFGVGELRILHEQNVVIPFVPTVDLPAVHQRLKEKKLARSNHNLATDIIACPGGDFCALANARSIPIANRLIDLLEDSDYVHDLGDLSINISGCMNACGHHHVGNVGVLGVDKDGDSWYQVTIGGSDGGHRGFSVNDQEKPRLGKVIGPSFKMEEMPSVLQTILNVYTTKRLVDEGFLSFYDRVGLDPFKEAVYGKELEKDVSLLTKNKLDTQDRNQHEG
jgi:sulfite reductase (NADPH) hemoprotein beta-component